MHPMNRTIFHLPEAWAVIENGRLVEYISLLDDTQRAEQEQ